MSNVPLHLKLHAGAQRQHIPDLSETGLVVQDSEHQIENDDHLQRHQLCQNRVSETGLMVQAAVLLRQTVQDLERYT